MFKTDNARPATPSAKGFTLIEIIVVLIIVGVLAALGLTQYGRLVEKSRGGEAKEIIGNIRKLAAAYHMQYGALTAAGGAPSDIANANVNIGTGADMNPSSCAPTHYFYYSIGSLSANGLAITATRCTTGGKAPQGTAAFTLSLTTDFSTGADTWAGTGNYQ